MVFIASGAGLRPSRTGIQAYTAAKHALVGLTKQLSWELGPAGVTVNAVAPGFVLSNPASRKQWENYGSEGQERLIEGLHQAAWNRRRHRSSNIIPGRRFSRMDYRSDLVG